MNLKASLLRLPTVGIAVFFYGLSCISCSPKDRPVTRPEAPPPTTAQAPAQPAADTVVAPLDTLAEITAIKKTVFETDRRIARGELSKKRLTVMSRQGGGVYGFVRPDSMLHFFHSAREGEIGGTILDCYFFDNQPVFAKEQYYKFKERPGGQLDTTSKVFESEASTYFRNGRVLQHTRKKLRKQAGLDDPADGPALLAKINDIQADLKRGPIE